jgi:two-component system response regulator YesN
MVLMILTNLHGKIIFQENFESPEIQFYQHEANVIRIEKINGSSVLVNINDLFRFKVPFFQSRSLGWAFSPMKMTAGEIDSFAFYPFFQLYIWDSKSPVFQSAQMFFARLEKAGDGRSLGLMLAGNLGDTIRVSLLRPDTFHFVSMTYDFSPDSLLKASVAVDGSLKGKIRIKAPPEGVPLLAFGPSSYVPVQGMTACTLALDNIVLSDSHGDDLFNLSAPPVRVESSGTGRIAFYPVFTGPDSLLVHSVSREPSFKPPLFTRDLPPAFCAPCETPFPLEKGLYYVKSAMIRKSGLQSDFTSPESVRIAFSTALADTLRVRDAGIYDESSGGPVTELEPEKWYVLEVRPCSVRGNFTLFWLHHGRYTFGGPHNKGGYFDRTRNYIFNFSFGAEPVFYASREDVKGRSVRVDGRASLYIDDSDSLFRPDTASGAARVRFKLLKEAEPGPWFLSGYTEREKNERSYFFRKPYRVLSEREIEAGVRAGHLRHNREIQVVIAAALLAGLAVLRVLLRRRSKSRQSSPSILEILIRDGVYIKDPNHRHRHIVQRTQQYVMANLDKDVALTDIAAHLDLTPTWVSIVFKRATGVTLVKFVNRVKIEKAKELMQGGNISATDVAMMVGYSSLDHFRRVFKEQTGLTPTDYRKKGA